MDQKILLLIVVVLALSLAACGGEDRAGSPAQPTADTAAEIADVGEAVPANSAPETTPPVEEAQPTAELSPTAETQPTAVPQPTEEPEVTEEPSEVLSEGWGESGSTAQSACDHPYFPLRTGAAWTMAGDGGEPITWEVVSVEGDMQSATAEMEMRSGELIFNYSWDCSQNGGLVSFGFGNQGLSALGPDVEITVSEGSGMFLAAAQELVPGYSWDTSYHSAYSLTQVDGDLETDISGEMTTLQTSIVLSDEPVTFGDVTVPGLLIQQDSQVDMIMSILEQSVENSMSTGGELELGRGLGMLRQTTFTDFGDFALETIEVYVP